MNFDTAFLLLSLFLLVLVIGLVWIFRPRKEKDYDDWTDWGV